MGVADDILALFGNGGAEEYFGESVSMTEHALQAAYFAQAAAAPPELIAAALLHDVGHLIEKAPSDISDWVVDARHEELGSLWLAKTFAPAVWQPVRLHVPAKRYLLATDPAYFAMLSPASLITLKLQGGPMNADEVARFEAEPFYREAVRVRQWDDQGKVPGSKTPGLGDYRGLIESLAAHRPSAAGVQ